MPRIKGVASGSIAEEGGVIAGEELLAINGERIADIFDYMFHSGSGELELLLRGVDGFEWILEVEKAEDEDIGLMFESGILDDPRPCANQCIFCFIDQLPRGMRETLYFKDDDIRMTFTNGNYVTLTNVGHAELSRIARYGLSPVNVSVHTTDPALRAKMLGFHVSCDAPRGHAPCVHMPRGQAPRGHMPRGHALERFDIVSKMRFLTESGITVNAQIVLCRNYNDGEELDKTLEELGRLGTNLASVSVVPSGLTKHRAGLPHLDAYDMYAAILVIKQIERWQKYFRSIYGRRIVFAADELYVLARMRIPGHAAYEGYPQLENGVGMAALFKKQFAEGLRSLRCCKHLEQLRSCAPGLPPSYVLTGRAASGIIDGCADKLRGVLPGIKIIVVPVENTFFGDLVTVSGLLTGVDLINCIKKLEYPSNSRFFISKSMLKYNSELFLDDYTLEMLRNMLKIDIIAVENDGRAFIQALLQGAAL